MATFPALTPSSRTFTAATYPGAVQLAYSGRESRVRTSNAQTGARFRLAFTALTEAQMLSIRDHYYGQLGRFIPFQLSTELLSGMANPSAVTPTGYQWIYVSSPKVTDLPTGTAAAPSCRHDVELELELVPEVSALVSGANWVALAAMAGGAADSGEILLSGATWSAAAAIGGGSAIYDGSASGAAWTAAASIVGGNTGTDPNFSSVALLLHMDGSNGSATFTDNSSNALTVTPSGNAQISTARFQYGNASALFDGSGDLLSTSTSSLFDFSSGSHTFEMWVYPTSFPSSGNVCRLWMFGANASAASFIPIQFASDGKPIAGIPLGGTSGITSSTALTLNTWQHYAVVLNGSSSQMFIDGTQVASGTITQPTSANNAMKIGYDTASTVNFNYAGNVDDVRITRNLVRYDSAFTPPTAAFPNS
jgi:hypothetical protein